MYTTLFWEAHFLYDFVNQKQNLLWKTWTQECHALHDFQRKDLPKFSFSSHSLEKSVHDQDFFSSVSVFSLVPILLLGGLHSLFFILKKNQNVFYSKLHQTSYYRVIYVK